MIEMLPRLIQAREASIDIITRKELLDEMTCSSIGHEVHLLRFIPLKAYPHSNHDFKDSNITIAMRVITANSNIVYI